MFYRRNKLIVILKPFSVILLLFSVFAIVWLRSGVVSLEYNISNLEKKRTELMIQRKILAAERAKLISVERFGNDAANSMVFPDRIKVVHVKKTKETDTYKATLLIKEKEDK